MREREGEGAGGGGERKTVNKQNANFGELSSFKSNAERKEKF